MGGWAACLATQLRQASQRWQAHAAAGAAGLAPACLLLGRIPTLSASMLLTSHPSLPAICPRVCRSNVGKAGVVKSAHEFLLPMQVTGRGGKVMLAGGWLQFSPEGM